MRKAISLGLIVLFFASVFVGCKKGENDSMSLLSRKARITGEWELIEADYTERDQNGTDTYDYNGSSMTHTYSGGSMIYTLSETAIINKDGTFEMEEKRVYGDDYYYNTYNMKVEGIWYFLDGSKELEVKDKERVEFVILKETLNGTYTGGGSFSSFDDYEGKSNSNVMILLLDRLANKELVTLFDYEWRDDDGHLFATEGTKTYEKQ